MKNLAAKNLAVKNLAVFASLVLGAYLPFAMVLANKSSPLLLAIAALASMATALLAGLGPRIYLQARSVRASQGGQGVAAIMTWMLISMLWAHDLPSSVSQFWQFILPIFFGLCLGLSYPWILWSKWAVFSAIAFGISAILIVVDLSHGLLLQNLLGNRSADFSYNRSLVALIVLVWPVLAALLIDRKHGLMLLLLPILPAIVISASGSATLAVFVAFIVWPLAWRFPDYIRRSGMLLFVLALFLAPFAGTIANRVLTKPMHETLSGSHSEERTKLLVSYEAAIRAKPFLGHGFGSSRNLQASSSLKGLPEDIRTYLADNHPHNSFVQIWVEMGLIGALLFAFLAFQLFKWTERLHESLQSSVLTWIAVVAAISAVSHGAWQAWWIAVIAASSVGFIALDWELQGRSDQNA